MKYEFQIKHPYLFSTLIQQHAHKQWRQEAGQAGHGIGEAIDRATQVGRNFGANNIFAATDKAVGDHGAQQHARHAHAIATPSGHQTHEEGATEQGDTLEEATRQCSIDQLITVDVVGQPAAHDQRTAHGNVDGRVDVAILGGN